MIELPFWADVIILIMTLSILVVIFCGIIPSRNLLSVFGMLVIILWLMIFLVDCGRTVLPDKEDARYRIGNWYTNEYSVTEESIVLHGYYYKDSDEYIYTDDEMTILGDSYRVNDRGV